MRARRGISEADGRAALAAWARGQASSGQVRTAVRYTLEEFARHAPGGAVEIRVPPVGVAQAVPGPRHTRGTPPNTVEMPSKVWLGLVTGTLTWQAALERGLHASGLRADLSQYLPLPGAARELEPGGDEITSTS